jgi:ABC-type transport system substrate-binding protein
VSRRFATDSYNGGVNSGGYSNPKLDALMAEALQQPTMATQLPLTNQIQKIISEDVPTVMLWYRNSIAATYTAALGGVIPERGGAWLQSNEWYMK